MKISKIAHPCSLENLSFGILYWSYPYKAKQTLERLNFEAVIVLSCLQNFQILRTVFQLKEITRSTWHLYNKASEPQKLYNMDFAWSHWHSISQTLGLQYIIYLYISKLHLITIYGDKFKVANLKVRETECICLEVGVFSMWKWWMHAWLGHSNLQH